MKKTLLPEKYIDNFISSYKKFLEKEKNKIGLQSDKRLPFSKSQIKQAIFIMVNKIIRNVLIFERIEQEVGTSLIEKENLLISYCHLLIYQPDDIISKFNSNKSWTVNRPLMMKLANELKDDLQKNTKEKLPNNTLDDLLTMLKLSTSK